MTVAAMKLCRKISQQQPLAGYIAEEIEPGPLVISDEDLLECARNCAVTIYHPVGTCKMGQANGAVVDSRLRVHGIERLRVVDASIMPAIVSGNTNAPAIMIGEKGAAMILADAR